MSQRIINVDEEITLNVEIKVKIDFFSNHNGFKDNQITKGIEEFKEEIFGEIKDKLDCERYSTFLHTVDFVNYTITSKEIK